MVNKKEKCIIVDFDGTLSDYKSRAKWRDINFQKYIDLSYTDVPNKPVLEIMEKFMLSHRIVILSARPESARQETEDWLVRYRIYYDKLILKKTGDDREDSVIKLELIQKSIIPNFDILFAIEDRISVVNLFRENGIFTLHCGEGY